MKETVDRKKPKLSINLQFEPIDENPISSITTGRHKTTSNTSKVSNKHSKDNQTINEYLGKANPS